MKCLDRKLLAAVTPLKSVLCSSLLLAGAITSGNAQAVVTTLPTGSILQFTAGVTTCVPGGGSPPCVSSASSTNVSAGSYFGMDTNGDSKIAGGEKTPIAPFYGIVIGDTMTATHSHTGAPDGSENPGVDKPWEFFGNTGMDFLTVPTSVLSVSGTGPYLYTLDFSGWRVTWNAIPSINMGTNAWQPLNCGPIFCTGQTFANGVANLTWSGVSGQSFGLTYSATVPAGDPSGFGGVHYYVYLTGNVIVPGALVSDTGAVTAGVTGISGNRLNDNDLATAGISADTGSGITYPLHLYYDFTVPAGGGTANIVIPLSSPLPAKAVYRKYNPLTKTWSNFTVDAFNSIQSAPGTLGTCPAPGNAAYTNGLTEGDYCVELTILNGGVDDTDTVGTTISDPGGIATTTAANAAQPDTRTSGTSGCSISPKPIDPLKRSDWWLLLGFVAWLGFWRRKRHH
ncbi:MAG: hypothetical protein ACYDDO_04605 [Acidiferrobacterales bacterium]